MTINYPRKCKNKRIILCVNSVAAASRVDESAESTEASNKTHLLGPMQPPAAYFRALICTLSLYPPFRNKSQACSTHRPRISGKWEEEEDVWLPSSCHLVYLLRHRLQTTLLKPSFMFFWGFWPLWIDQGYYWRDFMSIILMKQSPYPLTTY